MKKVTVVGAGLGGLASGVRLQKLGYQVDIFEKNSFPGGKSSNQKSSGFIFPIESPTFNDLRPLEELFVLGKNELSEAINLEKTEILFQAYFRNDKNKVFNVYENLPKLLSSLDEVFPKQVPNFLKYLGRGYEYINGLKNTNDKVNLKLIFTNKNFPSSKKYIKKIIKNKTLVDILSIHSLFRGIYSNFKGPFGIDFKLLHMLLYGNTYINQGQEAIVKELEQLFHSLGGKIHYNSSVDKILIENQKAYGVQIGNQLALSDYVICNTDFSFTMKHLIRSPKARGKYTDEYIDKMSYSPSKLIIGLGLKKDYGKIKHERYFISDDLDKNLKQIHSGVLLEDPTFILQPMLDSKSLSIIIPVSHLGISTYGWDEYTLDHYKNIVLKKIEKTPNLKDIKTNIKHTFFFTPLDFQSKFNSYNGSCYGFSPSYIQSYNRKPQITLKSCERIYFTGVSIHPRSEIASVLEATKHIANDILSQK